MQRRRNRRRRNNRRNNGNVSTGPSRGPRTQLRRTFREFRTVQLNNVSGSGVDGYSFYSTYLTPTCQNALGFKDAQQTFEFWKLNKFRVRVQPGYNSYNQTYNTVNLDALAAMQIWTAADWSYNETVSGVSITSYNNAKVHTLSLNGIKTVANTSVRINQNGLSPRTILGANTWLDTSSDISNSNQYSGIQFFARMQGQTATNYVASLQLILEYDVDFKQPAYQNRPDTFESTIIGSTLTVIPDGDEPEETREYTLVSYTINDSGNDYRFKRSDGVPGLLNYDLEQLWEVYYYRTSGPYFGNRKADYQGPVPRKPVGWIPATE